MSVGKKLFSFFSSKLAQQLIRSTAIACNDLQPYAVGAFNHCTKLKSTKL